MNVVELTLYECEHRFLMWSVGWIITTGETFKGRAPFYAVSEI